MKVGRIVWTFSIEIDKPCQFRVVIYIYIEMISSNKSYYFPYLNAKFNMLT